MRVCARCVLPETFPRIRFDNDGVCNYCLQYRPEDKINAKKERARRKFEDLAGRIRERKGYHCLLAYSGGKDSSYTLWLLCEVYKLRVVAVTFDNGFLSPQAFTNIRRVVEAVDADHIFVKPRFDLLRRIFWSAAIDKLFPMKALERASSICNACMGLVKSITLRMAIEQEIPILAYGWSPGQAPISASIFQMNEPMIQQMQNARIAPLQKIAGDELQPYLLTERHLNRASSLPYSVNPLAFHDYCEQDVIERARTLGWEPPEDTDGNSTNCLLNAYANRVHLQQYGFHPYAYEVAGLVRSGALTRDRGLASLADLGRADEYDAVERCLVARRLRSNAIPARSL